MVGKTVSEEMTNVQDDASANIEEGIYERGHRDVEGGREGARRWLGWGGRAGRRREVNKKSTWEKERGRGHGGPNRA